MLLFGLGAAIVMIGVVLGVALVEVKSLRIGHVHHANLWALAIFLTLVGCVLHLVGRRLERPLDPSSDQSLVGSYRQRFFLWVGCGEAPAFVGIILVVVTGRYWFYLLGAIFAFVAYARIVPTPKHLAEDQETLNQHGGTRSLVAALDSMPTMRR
jgi:Ca2+/Na+ antiporter